MCMFSLCSISNASYSQRFQEPGTEAGHGYGGKAQPLISTCIEVEVEVEVEVHR